MFRFQLVLLLLAAINLALADHAGDRKLFSARDAVRKNDEAIDGFSRRALKKKSSRSSYKSYKAPYKAPYKSYKAPYKSSYSSYKAPYKSSYSSYKSPYKSSYKSPSYKSKYGKYKLKSKVDLDFDGGYGGYDRHRSGPRYYSCYRGQNSHCPSVPQGEKSDDVLVATPRHINFARGQYSQTGSTCAGQCYTHIKRNTNPQSPQFGCIQEWRGCKDTYPLDIGVLTTNFPSCNHIPITTGDYEERVNCCFGSLCNTGSIAQKLGSAVAFVTVLLAVLSFHE